MFKGTKLSKYFRIRTIPWSGFCLVLGMWLGATLGRQVDPENYLLYSCTGLSVGLVFGWMIERSVKK